MSTPTPNPHMIPQAAQAVPIAVTRRILDRTRATQTKLKPQVALVARALASAGLSPAHGFTADELAAQLPLKAAKAVEVLQATFAEDAALAERLADVVGRFQAATEALVAVEGALANGAGPDDAQVTALKNAAYFLSKFHESVQDDALLAQLFPSPELLQADAGHAL